jgi:hypothetical protein
MLRQLRSKGGRGGGVLDAVPYRAMPCRATQRSARRWVLYNCLRFKPDRIRQQQRQKHHAGHQAGLEPSFYGTLICYSTNCATLALCKFYVNLEKENTIIYQTMLCYTILCYATLCYAMLRYIMLCYTTLYYTILYYTILYYTIQYYTILYYTILYYTILYYTILYYTILYYTILYYYGRTLNIQANKLGES